jgi:hypothetical protein
MSVQKNSLGATIPPCRGCGSQPAADDVDDVCPQCGEFKFLCGIIEHVPLAPDASPIRQQVRPPRWRRLPPSQVKPRPPDEFLTTKLPDNRAELLACCAALRKRVNGDEYNLKMAAFRDAPSIVERLWQSMRVIAEGEAVPPEPDNVRQITHADYMLMDTETGRGDCDGKIRTFNAAIDLVAEWCKLRLAELENAEAGTVTGTSAKRKTKSPPGSPRPQGDFLFFNTLNDGIRTMLHDGEHVSDPLTAEERQAYANYALAPVPGKNVILPATLAFKGGQSSFSSAAEPDVSDRSAPDASPTAAVEYASGLYLTVTSVGNTLSNPPDEDGLADRHAVGAIMRLWEEIPEGRRNLAIWGDDLINACCAIHGRCAFRCALGEFGSATHAIQRLAETILQELWIVAYEASNPTPKDDLPWTWNAGYRPFSVDWWYAALPALRRECGQLCERWDLDQLGLEHEKRSAWNVGLDQDWAAVSADLPSGAANGEPAERALSKLDEIKRALSCLRGVYPRWIDFYSRYGEPIKALDDYGVKIPPIVIGANGEAACLAQDTRLALWALYGHGTIPPALRARNLDDAIGKFPAWPTGYISAARNKAFLEDLPVQLEKLTQIYVELGDLETQLEFAPLSILERADMTAGSTPAGSPALDAEARGGGDGELPPAAEQYVTLDQMAALVNRSKKTLERSVNKPNSGAPAADVEGGGGKPHEWIWSTIRPWLEKQFNRKLPERFPR